MAAFIKVDSFMKAVAEKKHDLGSDQLAVVFQRSDPAGAAVLTDLNLYEVPWMDHLVNTDVETRSATQTAGLYTLKVGFVAPQAVGHDIGPFRYVVLYNKSAPAKELIGYWSIGEEMMLADSFCLFLWDALDAPLLLIG